MSEFDGSSNVLHAKIVYCGPALSGKTAMLSSLHRRLDPTGEFRLYSVDSADGRTLFFDLLPVREFELGPYRIRTRLFSTPGRPRYAPIRRCVVAHADCIVFVADARAEKLEENRASLIDLESQLLANDLDPGRLPILLAANKRDLEPSLTGEHLRAVLLERECPVFETVATEGKGVLEAFLEALRKTLAIAAVRTGDEGARAALLPSLQLLQHRLTPSDTTASDAETPGARRIVVSVPAPGTVAEPRLEPGAEPPDPDSCPRCHELAAGAVVAQTRLAELYDELDASLRQIEARNRELLGVNRVARSIISAMDVDNMLVALLDTVARQLNASHASCVVFDQTQKDGLRTHVRGFGSSPMLELPREQAEEFMQLLQASDAPILLDGRAHNELLAAVREVDSRISRALFAGVKVRGRAAGWLAIYQLADEAPLDSHTLLYISSLAGLASLGLEKIALLSEVRKFNTRLEEEVRKRTSELEMANAKIRALNRGLESRVAERTRALAAANNALKEAQGEALHATRLRAMGALAGDFAHQINNPVASLASNLAFMRETVDRLRTRVAGSGSETSEALEALDEFEQILGESGRSADRIERIIAGLKRFGREDVAESEVSLNSAVADAVTLLEDRIHACSELDLRLGDIPKLRCDPVEIGHVVLALLTNAVEATERKGERGTIRITTFGSKKKVTLVIEDSGVGIDQKMQKSVFEPFTSTKEGEPGAGLGLHAAHQAVQRRGGRIKVRSRLGEGATFTVVLPMQFKSEPEPEEPAAAAS